MTQKYTKVAWQDETTSQQGTLINAERLDQMQTAHHYADGFEEVDAVPTEDPEVDYHKVVFCTADTTFYRWDGTQWVKDVDDDTKALLLAHEADHNNPHVVTKAQVGLGNVDNTSDLDKPVSTATQAALDDKVTIIPVTSGVKFYSQSSGGTSLYQGTSSPVTGITSVPMRDSSGRIKTAAPSADDDTTNKKYVDDADALKLNTSALVSAWQGTPDDDHIPSEKLTKDSLDLKINTAALVSAWQVTPDDAHIPSEKLVKTYIDTSLTDGSVTKIGTATVGDNLKPIYLNAGVPTAVTNDLMDTATAQTIAGIKTFTSDIIRSGSGNPSVKIKSTDQTQTTPPSATKYPSFGFVGSDDSKLGAVEMSCYSDGSRTTNVTAYSSNGTVRSLRLFANNSEGYVTAPSRTYNSSNTSDVVTIGSLQASTDVVHTAGNETIAGIKEFSDVTRVKALNFNRSFPTADGNWYIAFRGTQALNQDTQYGKAVFWGERYRGSLSNTDFGLGELFQRGSNSSIGWKFYLHGAGISANDFKALDINGVGHFFIKKSDASTRWMMNMIMCVLNGSSNTWIEAVNEKVTDATLIAQIEAASGATLI